MYFVLPNFDLLTLGVSVAAIGILGVVVFLERPQSSTNRAFLFVAIMTALYGAFNYLNYQIQNPEWILWLIRIVIFFAVWHAFSLFHLFFVFPKVETKYPSWYSRLLLPIVAGTSLLTLSPLVFSNLSKVGSVGEVSTPEIGLAAPVFFLIVAGLVIGGVYLLLSKTFRAEGVRRTQFLFVLIGTFISFSLLLILNLLMPIVFHSVKFIPFSGLSLLPFIAFTAYAIMKYRLLNIKVIGTELTAFILSIVTLLQVITATTVQGKLFETMVFLLVLTFSFILIKGVIREVQLREEVEQLAQNLEHANEKLKEMDKLKSQFLSIASHDLRAPLTVIRNFMSLLLDGTYGKLPQAGQEGLQQVFDRATDMAKSVETYLNVSRIEQGRMKYDFVQVELTPMVEAAAKAFKTNAEKKGLAFSFSASPELAGKKVKVDTVKMNEVLNNLFDNSIKYTLQGSIAVTLIKNGTMARLTIKDTGVGMSKETIGKLFQLFSTAEDSRKVNTTSTGVGLYVVKAHVEAHGGKVWAESEGEGRGSTFILELPLLT